MQEVIRNSPNSQRPKRIRKKKQWDMPELLYTRKERISSRPKEGRKADAPTTRVKDNGKLSKEDAAKREKRDNNVEDGSEESNIDDHRNDDEEEEDSEEQDEESVHEETLGEGMFEIEAIRKKRTRKVLASSLFANLLILKQTSCPYWSLDLSPTLLQAQ